MAGAIVQAPAPVIDDSGANSPTIAFTLTGVTAGNTIAVHVGWGSATETCTVSDGTAYSIADAVRTDGAGQRGQVFYLDNVSAGSHVITATFSATVGFRRIRAIEISGLNTAGSLDQATGQGQLAPGTGTDAVSSGATSTTTNAADFVLGLTQNSGEISPGSGTVTAGTGFTLSGAASVMMTVESMSVAATGAQTATFTHSVANNRITHVVAFMEAAAGGAAPSAGLRLPTVRPDSRPARSPQTARFNRPPRPYTAPTAITGDLTGIATASTSAYGALTGAAALSGLASATSMAYGALSATGALSGLAISSATAYGAASLAGQLNGLSIATSSSYAAVSGAAALAGLAVVSTSAYGPLTASATLNGLAVSTTTSYADLQAFSSGAMSGLAMGSASAFGALSGTAALTGLASSTVITFGSLTASGGEAPVTGGGGGRETDHEFEARLFRDLARRQALVTEVTDSEDHSGYRPTPQAVTPPAVIPVSIATPVLAPKRYDDEIMAILWMLM
jgi:hypothetical protein